MRKFYEKRNISNAIELRKNMTKQEKHLWYDFLRTYKIKTYKQRAIGKYIVDFYCPAAKLAIELDGSQHYDDPVKEYDKLRTAELEKYGIDVIRFPNNEIDNNFYNVCNYIDALIQSRLNDIYKTSQSASLTAPL